MKYGLYVPNFGRSSHPQTLARMAIIAEKSGWDRFFLWDHIVEWNKRVLLYDTFTSLAAIAASTSRIRIGTTVTPLARLKPWLAARQTASLDHLSDGRLILGVGLGAEESCDYERWGETPDNRVLAEKLDESLEIVTGLWTDKKFSCKGKHYRIGETVFLPPTRQKPRIPWVGGFWPRKGPFRRAARWDGVIPLKLPVTPPTPEDLREITAYIRKRRGSMKGFDVVKIGWTTGMKRKKAAEWVQPFSAVGATWWLESMYTSRDSPDKMKKRIREGPPEAR